MVAFLIGFLVTLLFDDGTLLLLTVLDELQFIISMTIKFVYTIAVSTIYR